MPDFDAGLITLVVLALTAGGLVKGVVGIGLPIVTIAILSNFLPLPLVLGLVVVPIALTNLWQAVQSGNLLVPLKRFWPMTACLLVFVWLSAHLVVELDPRVLYAVLGLVVIFFAASDFIHPSGRVPPKAEIWAGPLAGTLGGILGGVSTIWGPPMTIYFVLLRLTKEEFVQAVGLVWFAGSIPLVAAFVDNGLLNGETVWLSLGACLPAMVGLGLGQWVRQRIHQALFRKALLLMLFVIGLNLLRRAVF